MDGGRRVAVTDALKVEAARLQSPDGCGADSCSVRCQATCHAGRWPRAGTHAATAQPPLTEKASIAESSGQRFVV